MWPFKRKDHLLTKDWVRENIPPKNAESFTPDLLWLERHEWCLLFVYCELMLSRKLYPIINESVSLGQAFTADENWSLWKKKLGEQTFPIAIREGLGTPRRIKGEVHAVRPEVFWKILDKRLMNGVEFRRERVQVLVPYRIVLPGQNCVHPDPLIRKLRVHMYVGIADYWTPQLDGGYQFSLVKSFRPRVNWADGYTLGTYYYYSRLEDATNF